MLQSPMKKNFKYLLPCLILINACQAPNTSNMISTNNNTGEMALINSDVSYTKKDDKANTFEKIYGSYRLSDNFMIKLNNFTLDKVLNKTEINQLIEEGSKTEKAFMTIIKNKESFIMTNLKINDSYPDELDFIINKDFSITGDFIKKLSVKVSDNLLDKNEINNLSKIANVEEKSLLEKISTYDKYNNFPFIDSNNKINYTDLNMYYDEKNLVQGDSMLDILSNIGQSDRLDNTSSDEIRCGAGVIVNAILLTKGESSFYDLAKRLGLDLNSLTYENIHLVQEKLMNKVNESKGLSISKNVEKNILIGGSLLEALTFSQLNWDTEGVKKVNGSFKDDINNYFKKNSNGTIILTGFLDKNMKKMVFNKTTNHSCLLSYRNNKFILTDTSGRNGSGLNNLELNDNDLQEIYTSNQMFIKIFS